MNVTVRIPTPIRQYTQQQPEVALEGKTVGEVLEAFKARFPEAGTKFFSSSSRASRFVNLYLNDEDIRFLKDLDTPVKDKDTLSIILAIAGGANHVLLTRKSFAAWKEFFFADFFALFASWRLMRDSTFTAKTRRTQRKRQED